MVRCKAPEILRSEAYFSVRCNDEGPAVRQGKRRRWAFFNSLLDFIEWGRIDHHPGDVIQRTLG
jgi:hypothetical protein